MTFEFKNLINGEWTGATGGKTFQSHNPADFAAVVGTYPASVREDAERAFGAAEAALPAWRNVPAPKRGEILYRAAELLSGKVDQLAKEMTAEEGKTLPEARGEVMRTINIFRYFGGEAARLNGEVVPSERDGVFCFTIRKPRGVVSLITPWNFPIAIPAWKMAPALICGNTVVIKPAALAPSCTFRLAEALVEAGLPNGVLNVVTGSSREIGDTFVNHPSMRAISFTGSCGVGDHIYNTVAPRKLPAQLEMGGKNPTIVLKDADLDYAVDTVMNAAFASTGQKCTATSRAIIEAPIYDEFVSKLVAKTKALKVGDGAEAGVYMGPCADEAQLKTVLSYIEKGKSEGCQLLVGGNRLTDGAFAKGYFIAPTIFGDVSPDATIAQEEIFGPVLALIRASDYDDALRLANKVRFGLSASILTKDLSAAFKYIHDIEAGLITVNLPSAGVEYQLPFGGVKDSSSGYREQGSVAINFYSGAFDDLHEVPMMIEELLTIEATLPKDAPDAALVGRVDRPGLGPSVVRVNPDSTLTDITAEFPTVSRLCNHSNPAVSLRNARGENIGDLADVLESRSLLAPIDLQTVKAAGVTFPVSMIERMIEEALRGDLSNSSKRSEAITKIRDSVGTISALTPASPQALELLAYLTDPDGLGLSATYPQVGLGEKAEIFTKQAVLLATVGHGAEAGYNAESKWTNPEPELVSVINAHGTIVGAALGNDVNDRYLEGLSALLLGVAKDRRGSSAVGPFIRLFDDTFTLASIRNIQVNLIVRGEDGFEETGINSMADIRRDPQDSLASQLFDIHDYPDGVVLFNGTGIVPTSDRSGPGSGFFHKTGDVVHIFADELGSLANVMVPTGEVSMHAHSLFDFMSGLARRGVLNG